MLSEEYLTNSVTKSTPGSRRVTPSKTLPTEVRTPNSKKDRQFGGSVHKISVETVQRVLTAEIKCKYAIIDCRYPYEYSGGHIAGALNCSPGEKLSLIDWLFSKEHGLTRQGPLVLIMHCEFSQCRAPRMATDVLRQYSSMGVHAGLEVYVMKGGYAEFFSNYPQLCEPAGYVAMHDPRQFEITQSDVSFDVEHFTERLSLSSQKDARHGRSRSRWDSPFFQGTTCVSSSPMDFSPVGVVADLARVFVEESGHDDSSSGSRRTATINTEDDYLDFEDDDYDEEEPDEHSLLFSRYEDEHTSFN